MIFTEYFRQEGKHTLTIENHLLCIGGTRPYFFSKYVTKV